MKQSKRYRLVLSTAAAMLVPAYSDAQEMASFEFPGNANMAGLGLVSVPDFYGSSDNEAAVAPVLRYHFGGNRYVQLLGPELALNLVDRKEFRAGPLIRARSKRDDDVDDDVVSRMRRVATATELGAFAEYHLFMDRSHSPLHKMVFATDIATNTTGVYNGVSGNVRVNYFYPFTQGWTGGRTTVGSVGLGMFFASGSFNRTYFGVTGSDVALFPERGGEEYRPDSGVTSIKIPFSVSTQLSKTWLLTVGGRYERLLGDAKDSPIIKDRGDENQWALGAAVSYMF